MLSAASGDTMSRANCPAFPAFPAYSLCVCILSFYELHGNTRGTRGTRGTRHLAFAKRRTRSAPFQHVSGSLPYVTPRAWMRDIA